MKRMERRGMLAFVLLCAFLLVAGAAAAEKMSSATGKVTALDPGGKGILIVVGSGTRAMDVGTVVTPDTMIKVKGKKATLSDIKVGDTVTIRYEKSTDLYAKEIVMK